MKRPVAPFSRRAASYVLKTSIRVARFIELDIATMPRGENHWASYISGGPTEARDDACTQRVAPTVVNTTGMVVVAAFAACAARVPNPATSTSGLA